MDVPEVKKRYAEFEKKYKLPEFKELNEAFEIDKLDRDSECFLRAIRKIVMEKLVNSMGFVEMLLNPVNAPRLYYSYLKSISTEDIKSIENIYGKLADLSIDSLSLEIDYDEAEEGKLIHKSFILWESLRPGLKKIIEHIQSPKSSVQKEKTYFD